MEARVEIADGLGGQFGTLSGLGDMGI